MPIRLNSMNTGRYENRSSQFIKVNVRFRNEIVQFRTYFSIRNTDLYLLE